MSLAAHNAAHRGGRAGTMSKKRCLHSKGKRDCVTCTPCPHGKLERNCAECNSCPHGKLRGDCAECNPCPHGKVKGSCADCNPCPHGKLKKNCADCNPCPHGKVKNSCAECNPCPHGKVKGSCADCNPCPHGKVKNNCLTCKGCPHGKRTSRCAACKAARAASPSSKRIKRARSSSPENKPEPEIKLDPEIKQAPEIKRDPEIVVANQDTLGDEWYDDDVQVVMRTPADLKREEDDRREDELRWNTLGTAGKHSRPKPAEMIDLTDHTDEDEDKGEGVIHDSQPQNPGAVWYTHKTCGFEKNFYLCTNYGYLRIRCDRCRQWFCTMYGGDMRRSTT